MNKCKILVLAIVAAMSSAAIADSSISAPATVTIAAPELEPVKNAIWSDPSNTDINQLVGADAFYSAGYTGSSAIVTNVEGGHVWDGHQTLTPANVTTFLHSADSASATTGVRQYDRHATWVGHHIAGTPGAATPTPDGVERGIAYGSELWSGGIATSWVDPGAGNYAGSFNASADSLITPYRDAVFGSAATGLRTTDVVNSSWGNSTLNDGGDYIAVATDALANDSAKTFVFSAGNSGAVNTVGSPGSGFNSITVGASGSDGTGYDRVTDFSSLSPSDVYNPGTGVTIAGARAAVDIVAPGQDLIGAWYGGGTGGNTFGAPIDANTDFYSFGINGTSFSSPIVAGSAALVVDANRSLGNLEGVDGRVVKSILLNSASKNIADEFGNPWTNGQVNSGGVITTTQSLDYNSGAGALDLTQAYDQTTGGTTGTVLDASRHATVETTGWDLATVSEGTHNEYYLADRLLAGTDLTVTLSWFVDTLLDELTLDALYGSMDNLDLQVWKTVAGVADTLVAESISVYNNVEHLFFEITETADYMIRVLWAGENWDLLSDVNSETYGLAWMGTAAPAEDGRIPVVPVWVLMLSGLLLLRRRLA